MLILILVSSTLVYAGADISKNKSTVKAKRGIRIYVSYGCLVMSIAVSLCVKDWLCQQNSFRIVCMAIIIRRPLGMCRKPYLA